MSNTESEDEHDRAKPHPLRRRLVLSAEGAAGGSVLGLIAGWLSDSSLVESVLLFALACLLLTLVLGKDGVRSIGPIN